MPEHTGSSKGKSGSQEVERQASSATNSDQKDPADRRDFMAISSSVAMGGGLLASYGTLAALAGRYLYAEDDESITWQFVAVASEVPEGGTVEYTSPAGAKVLVSRKGEGVTSDDFLALSSVCPHLGCQVHWEAHNERFFCPCHNGAFDPEGNPIAGPVVAGDQKLPRYELEVNKDGLIFIKVPTRSVTNAQAVASGQADPTRPQEGRA